MTERIRWDHPVTGDSKGSILLVHGTAPMNIRGNIPGCDERYPLGAMSLYEELSQVLTDGGWSTLRYMRPGVHEDAISPDEYVKVDHEIIVDQLKELFESMPDDKPRIVFCWSGGSLHVPHLPLDQVDGVIITGGISTSRSHLGELHAGNPERWRSFHQEMQEFTAMSYEAVMAINRLSGDGPLVRFWQEAKRLDNWHYFRGFPSLPMLVLHGADDEEVYVSQAQLWKQLLPCHNISVVERQSAGHFLGTASDNGAEFVGNAILKWLANTVRG